MNNIYVVSECWWRDGATVIGAGTERAEAEKIAERRGRDGSAPGGWAPWKEDVSPAEGSCTWRRDALMADGTTHASLYQEIVCVPLAGLDPGDLIRDWPIYRDPVPQLQPAAETLTMNTVMSEWRELIYKAVQARIDESTFAAFEPPFTNPPC